MITLSTLPARGEQIIAQAGPDALIVFHLESGEYYSLDHVGSRIWGLCDGGHTISQIVDQLCGEYDTPRVGVQADVLELVTEFEKEGLIDASSIQRAGAEQAAQSR